MDGFDNDMHETKSSENELTSCKKKQKQQEQDQNIYQTFGGAAILDTNEVGATTQI